MTGFAWWFRLRGSRCYFRAASARRSYQNGAGAVVAIVFAIGILRIIMIPQHRRCSHRRPTLQPRAGLTEGVASSWLLFLCGAGNVWISPSPRTQLKKTWFRGKTERESERQKHAERDRDRESRHILREM